MYLSELPTGRLNKYHLLFSNYNSMFVRVEIKKGNVKFLISSLFISCLNCVCKRDQKVPKLVALIFCKLEICDKRNQEIAQILLQTPWHLMKVQIILISL